MKAIDVVAKESAGKEKKEVNMTLTLMKDKVTKNKVVRFSDGNGHNLYLQPDEVKALGEPEAIKVTIAKNGK